MKKHLFVCSFLLLWHFVASAQSPASNWYSIKGFLPAWYGAYVEVVVNGNTVHADTLRKELFSYTGTTTGIQEGLVKITLHKKKVFLPLFIEPGTIKIRDHGKKLVVFGTPSNDLYGQLNKQVDSLALLKRNLSISELSAYKKELVAAYMRTSPKAAINLQLLTDHFHLDGTANDTLFFSLYNTLDSQSRLSSTGKKLQADVAQRVATSTGHTAPLLFLPDTSNQLKPLYEKGAYTLINFWASWCLPCKREHPALIQLYKKFAAKGLTIVSVSLDTNRSAWLNGIKQEKLEWQQRGDLQGWNSKAAKTYGIASIPYNILIDANGKILGKKLNILAIEQLLNQHLTSPL